MLYLYLLKILYTLKLASSSISVSTSVPSITEYPISVLASQYPVSSRFSLLVLGFSFSPYAVQPVFSFTFYLWFLVQTMSSSLDIQYLSIQFIHTVSGISVVSGPARIQFLGTQFLSIRFSQHHLFQYLVSHMYSQAFSCLDYVIAIFKKYQY